MMFIEANMNAIIQYAILATAVLLLVVCHNFLIGTAQQNPFKRSGIDLTFKEQVGIFLIFFVSTILLMFIATISTSQFRLEGLLDGLIAITMIPITSFFIIQTFNRLLGVMKENKLSYKLLWNPYFLLTTYLIIVTELIFLNWIKEITTVQQPFVIFVVLYSVLVVAIGFFLGIPKQNEEGLIFPQKWQWRAIILLDPIIIVLLTGIVIKIILDIILFIQ